MKKIFSIVAALVAAVSINATSVVLTPANMPQLTTAGKYDQQIDGVHVELSSGIVNNTEMRIYKNQTLTLSVAEGTTISAIVFTCTAIGTAQYGPGCFDALEGYSYDGNKGTWIGSEQSVSFKAASNQVRASKIVVYLDGDGPVATTIDTIGVSAAIARINAGEGDPCYVKGVVAGDPFLLGKNGPAFYMTDVANPADSLQGFMINKDANTAYASVDEMASDFGMGDTILVFATGLAKYNDTFETTGGYFVKVLGKSAARVIDWNVADASRENGVWTLTIAESNAANANNVVLSFASANESGIAGYHALNAESGIVENGTKVAFTAGSVTLTFKEISNNNYNVYDVKMSAVAGNDTYRIASEMEIPAFDAEGEEIVLSADRPFVPKDGDVITCAQAKEYTLSLSSGETSPMSVTVEGYVTDLFSNGKTFWMADAQGDEKVFEAYNISSVSPEGVGLQKGAKVRVTGRLTNYNGTTAEISGGAVVIVEGGVATTVHEVTVAEAIAAGEALAQGATSTDLYKIEGYVTGIVYAYDASYGNVSFWMSDANDGAQVFQAYRAKCDAAIAEQIVEGARVRVVSANIQHFHQDAKDDKPERTVIEAVNGTVELISGAGVEDVKAAVRSLKVMENGMMYVERDGVRYTMQGQIVK